MKKSPGGKNNKRQKSSNPTNNEYTGALFGVNTIITEQDAMDFYVEEAKNWVDNGSRL